MVEFLFAKSIQGFMKKEYGWNNSLKRYTELLELLSLWRLALAKILGEA